MSSNLNKLLERDSNNEIVHFNSIHVVVSGNRITPKPTVQCFHSERGTETIEDIQYMIDKLLDSNITLSHQFYNDITFNFCSDVINDVPLVDIYFNTELDDENQYVIEMTEEFMDSIIRK